MDDDAVELLIFFLCIAVGTGFGACIGVCVGRESTKQVGHLFGKAARNSIHSIHVREYLVKYKPLVGCFVSS